jgi:hypothetical protein
MPFAGTTVSLAGDGIYVVTIAFQVPALVDEPRAFLLMLLPWCRSGWSAAWRRRACWSTGPTGVRS